MAAISSNGIGRAATALRGLRRRVAYRLLRPRPFLHPSPLRGPALVVGSAPDATRPEALDRFGSVISINASQVLAEQWGLGPPDATLMHYFQVRGDTPRAAAVRTVLEGKSTNHLCMMRWKESRQSLTRGLAAFDYRPGSVAIVGLYERMALFDHVLGELNDERDRDEKVSNGVVAILYALASGASAVVIAGINPHSSGHVYNDLGLGRLHVDSDARVLRRLVELGKPLYTADSHVADSLGLPLWRGEESGTSACP